MAHVITRSCCNDGSCVEVCPVNCIHPTPGEPEFLTAEMLYIDPDTCIDCGACIDECPVGAIVPDDSLDLRDEPFLQINADYYRDHDVTGGYLPPAKQARLPRDSQLRVAVVGAGPAGFYAAQELVKRSQISVDVFDSLPTPYGLVRAGVAPDHPQTKGVEDVFGTVEQTRNFTYHLNVEVGEHITVDELRERYGAVLYAVGAPHDRRLDVAGEDLPGSIAATDFVAWYNGHPDFADRTFDLRGPRAVVIGNGNVALDVARMLLADQASLAATDVADHALAALADSAVTEVVVAGRRGIEHAAFTNSEFLALRDSDDVDIVVDPAELLLSEGAQAALADGTLDSVVATKIRLAREMSDVPPAGRDKRIVFRFLAAPSEISGDGDGDGDGVTRVSFTRNAFAADGTVVPTAERLEVDASLAVRAIGYRGRRVRGLPFDDRRGVVPSADSRVLDDVGGEAISGLYVAGWIRRGPTGGIGRNRLCGIQAAEAIVADFAAGRLPEPPLPADDVAELVVARGARRVDLDGWKRIDAAERAAGREAGRRRVKMVRRQALEDAAEQPNR